jgi:hypothetical protein
MSGHGKKTFYLTQDCIKDDNMLEPGDIEHIESKVNKDYPLRNCGSWNRIKQELSLIQDTHKGTLCEAHSSLFGKICAVTGVTCTSQCYIIRK